VEQEEGGGGRDLIELLSDISTVETAMRVARIKRDTAAVPDGILRKHVMTPDTLEVLRLSYCLITACGTQPTAWSENLTTLLLKDGKGSGESRQL
jgi:hypothetical protein